MSKIQIIFQFLKRHKLIVSLLVYAVVALFVVNIVRQLLRDWGTVNWDVVRIDIRWIIAFFIVSFTRHLVFSRSWQMAQATFGVHVSFQDSFCVYFKSQLGKFIPGKVGIIVFKVIENQKRGISAKVTTFAGTLEFLLQTLVMLVVGSAAIFFLGDKLLGLPESWNYLLIPIIGAAVFFTSPKYFSRFSKLATKLFKKDPIHQLDALKYYRIVLLKLVGTILSGTAIFCIISSVVPVGFENLFYIVSASSLSFVIGVISIFVPSGIGVRETILIYLLNVIMSTPMAALSTLLVTLFAYISEFTAIGIAYLIDTKRLKTATFEQDCV